MKPQKAYLKLTILLPSSCIMVIMKLQKERPHSLNSAPQKNEKDLI